MPKEILKLQEVVNHSTWLLGTELGSFAIVAGVLNH